MLEPDFERLYDRRTGLLPRPHRYARRARPPLPHQRRSAADGAASTACSTGPRPRLSRRGAQPALRRRGAAAQRRDRGRLVGRRRPDRAAAATPSAVLAGISAQVVWTLRQLGIRTVRDPGRRRAGGPVDGIPAQQTSTTGRPSTRTRCRWTRSATTSSAGALRTVTTGEPVPGPAGDGCLRPHQRRGVGRRPHRGAVLPRGRPADASGRGQLLRPARTAASSRRCSTARRLTRADRRRHPRRDLGGARRHRCRPRAPADGRRRRSTRPRSRASGRADVLQLSPDGVRAALVVDGRRPRLYVGTVVRDEDGGVALRDLRADRADADPGRRRRLAGQRGAAGAGRRRRRRPDRALRRSASTAGG